MMVTQSPALPDESRPLTGGGLALHLLRAECRAEEPVALPAFSGSAIRGALFGAVRDLACANQMAPSCAACPFHRICGVSLLLATVDQRGPRGMEVPRPYVLRPPLDGARLVSPGETISFGLALIGDEALQLLPYLVLGLRRMGSGGLGRLVPGDNGDPRRGQFAVASLMAVNPFTGVRRAVMQTGAALVTLPDAPVTAGQIVAWSTARGDVRQLTLRLRPPLRLVADGHLTRRRSFAAVMRRLCRRVTDLVSCYGDGAKPDFRALLEQAAAVQVAEDPTEWLELESRSAHQGRTLPIGGLVGMISFAGHLPPFLPLLTLAEFTGNDTAKGNGIIEVVLPPSQ